MSYVNDKELERRVVLFRDKVCYWQKILGIMDVEINVAAIHPEADSGRVRASWHSDVPGMIITMFYSEQWLKSDDVKDSEVDKVAFHEVFECQFHKIHAMLRQHFSGDEADRVKHEIVRRAENCIWPVMREVVE